MAGEREEQQPTAHHHILDPETAAMREKLLHESTTELDDLLNELRGEDGQIDYASLSKNQSLLLLVGLARVGAAHQTGKIDPMDSGLVIDRTGPSFPRPVDRVMAAVEDSQMVQAYGNLDSLAIYERPAHVGHTTMAATEQQVGPIFPVGW